MNKTAVFLMGPTAAGKTALAMQLAERFPFDLISVDSAMVYRGMDIGTGKPTPAELKRFPHRLIDICDPEQPYSAQQFCEDAFHAMNEIIEKGRFPLLVGGTMMYFRALQYGLSPLPEANPEIRMAIAKEAEEKGWAALHAQLQILDPDAAGRIRPTDPQRIQRALEVCAITGRSMTTCWSDQTSLLKDWRIIPIALVPHDRSWLHAVIEKRFNAMLEQGLLEEVEKLYGRVYPLELPALRAVGYRQVWEYFSGKYNYQEMVQRAVAATRQLAKRQWTWLRSWEGVQNIDAQSRTLWTDTSQLVSSIF